MIAVIPARGGSRRLPRKNVLAFFGHPMLAYAIAAAQNSALFDRVVVSTEDPEIMAIASAYGAETLKRPAALAADDIAVADVTRHAVEALDVRDAVCQLMPNCPLRRSQDIVAHLRAFDASGATTQISVMPYRVVHPEWALERDADGIGHWIDPVALSRPAGSPWCPTGAVWWARAEALRERSSFYDGPFRTEPIDANRGVDIDHHEDLELAELLVRGLRDRDGDDPLESCARIPGH